MVKTKDEPAHPSHALVQLSRVSGRRNLFRSPVTAQAFMRITVSRASSDQNAGLLALKEQAKRVLPIYEPPEAKILDVEAVEGKE